MIDQARGRMQKRQKAFGDGVGSPENFDTAKSGENAQEGGQIIDRQQTDDRLINGRKSHNN